MKKKLQNLMGIVFVVLALMTNIQANTCVSETITLDSNVSSAWSAECNSTTEYGTLKYEKVYTFTLAQTEAVGIDLTSDNMDVELGLYSDLNGTYNLLDSTQPIWVGEGITRMLESGTYIIKVTSEQLVDFTLSLATLPISNMHFSGSIIIPSSLQDIYATCSGNDCPTMQFKVSGYNYIGGDANITFNGSTSTYDYNLTYAQIIPTSEADNQYEVSIYIKNGDMGNESIYYSFGADNAIGNIDNVVDGDDSLLHNRYEYDENYNYIYKKLHLPLSQTNVNLDIDLSSKNEGRQKIVGKVKVPESVTNLSTSWEEGYLGVSIESILSNESSYIYLEGTPDSNGEYSFVTGFDTSIGTLNQYKVSINGRLNGVYFNTYYQISEDVNDTDDHSIDGDEKFVTTMPAFSDYVEFNNTVGDLGILDIAVYFDGSVILTGVVTPPSEFFSDPTSYDYINLQFTSGTDNWYATVGSWSTEVNGTYAYSIQVIASQMAEIEANGLSLNLNFYQDNVITQYNYTFGDDRTVGGIDANLDHVVINSIDTPQSLLIDFNATVPNIDINLSSFVPPATGNVLVTMNAEPNVDGINIVAYDVNSNTEIPITAYYDTNGLTLHNLKENHNYAIEVTYNINGMPSNTVYMLNDDDGNFTNGGVFLEEARYVTNEQNISVLDTATIAGGVDMTLSPFDFIVPNQIIFEGNVLLPESLTSLFATCEGTNCPSVVVYVEHATEYVSVDSEVQLPSGTYSMGISPMIAPTTKDENAYRVRVDIYNGNMGNETFYYDFGIDNAISADDTLSRNWTESTIKLDLNNTNVNLDINLTDKDVGRQAITGKIKLPAGMTLGDYGDGAWNSLSVSLTPVIYDSAMNSYMEDWNVMGNSITVSETPDANGTYTFTGSVDYDDTVGSRLKLSINGQLNGENINLYYMVGMDSNGSYDFTIDGNEALVDQYLPAESHIYFPGAVADFGVLDIEAYLNSGTYLTGTFTPPSDAQEISITLEFSSTDGADFSYVENKSFWFMNATEVQNFSIRIPSDKYAGIEENNLTLNINFGSKTRAYSFEVPNRMLDETEDPSVAVPLVLDFNASLPVLDIDLSGYETPGKQQVTGKIKLPAGMTLGDNGDGTWNYLSVNVTPVIYDSAMNSYMEDWNVMGSSIAVSETPDANGTYTFTGSVDYDDTVGSRLKLSINGQLNGENINLYYMVGMDSNGSYDFTIDGNEALVDQYLPAESHIYFPDAVADFGVLDIEAYYIANDHTAPLITLLGVNPQTLERGTSYVELNASTDDGSVVVIDSSAVDMNVAGTYTVTYNATDASGNVAVEVSREVVVEDTIAPVITLLGANPKTLEKGSVYLELNATIDDNITAILIDSSAVDMNSVGEYNVTYNATDASGNVAQEVNRTIIIEDTIAPIITLIGANPQMLERGTSYVELNATTDDGSVVEINSAAVDMNVAGTYTVTYNAIDASGNVAVEVSREVVVLVDTDGDGIPDVTDTDDDNDGVPDSNDDLPLNPNESVDTDGDGVGNNADRDDDNDGISDVDERRWGFDPLDASDGGNADADGDGVSNADEIEAGSDPLDPDDTKKPKRYVPIMMDDMVIMVPMP